MEVVIKKKTASAAWKPSQRSLNLLAARGEHYNGSIEWISTSGVALTESEIQALRRKHRTRTPNLIRATEVKRLMLEGKRCMEIAFALRKKYGERMVKADHAALSPDRGGAKKGR